MPWHVAKGGAPPSPRPCSGFLAFPCRVATFSRMRDEMVYAALRCRQPKWWVLLGLVRGRRWSEAELFYAPDEVRRRGPVGGCLGAPGA